MRGMGTKTLQETGVRRVQRGLRTPGGGGICWGSMSFHHLKGVRVVGIRGMAVSAAKPFSN
jgi:hypothetical protein